MPAQSGGNSQREFPYRALVQTNGRRSKDEFEYELLDTGVFDENRYFDVFLLIRIAVHTGARRRRGCTRC
jgi:hypothetical protein